MSKTATYSLIASNTLGSATGTVTFSSITGTYTDLILICVGTGASNTGIGLQFNGDTAANYSATFLEGNGTAATSERQTSTNNIRIAWNALWDTASPGNVIVNIQDYSNTTTNKAVIARSNKSDRVVGTTAGLWRNTAAITSLSVIGTSANFAAGSTFKLYGIEDAK